MVSLFYAKSLFPRGIGNQVPFLYESPLFAFDITYPSAKLAPVPVCVCAGTFDIFKKPPDQMPQPSKLSEAPEPRKRGTVLSSADGCVINNGNGGFCEENVTFLTHTNLGRGLQTVSTGRTICKQGLPKMATDVNCSLGKASQLH